MGVQRLLQSLIAHPVLHNTLMPLVRTPGVRVLMYHRIVGDDAEFSGLHKDMFHKHILWITKHYQPIPLQELDHPAHSKRRKKPAVLLTFDDGYADFFDNAYPVLRDYNVPALAFLPTEAINEGGTLWTEQLRCWLNRAKSAGAMADLQASLVELFGGLRGDLVAHLKSLPNSERLAVLLHVKSAIDALGLDTRISRQMMTWEQINATRPFIDYGGHTHSHPIVSRMSSAEFEAEMRVHCDALKTGLGELPTAFAWPNGRPEDCSTAALETLKSLGFEHIFTTVQGVYTNEHDPFHINRLPSTTPDTIGLNTLMAKAN